MRKLFFLLFAVSMIFSCGKEAVTLDTVDEYNNEITESRNGVEGLVKGIQNRDGMLVFDDLAHFKKIADDLSTLTDEHDDAFVARYDDLSIDDLEIVEERIGHDEFQPLIDFEKILRFDSRRILVERLTQDWLNNKELDERNNPDNMDNNSEAVRTLLNEEGLVIIKGEVIDMNVKAAPPAECWTYGVETDQGSYDNGKRKWTMKVTAAGLIYIGQSNMGSLYGPQATCKVCNYKKRNNGNWKKKRTTMRVEVEGDYRNRYCDRLGTIGTGKTRKRRCYSRSRTIVDGYAFGFKDGDVCGGTRFSNYPEVDETVCINN